MGARELAQEPALDSATAEFSRRFNEGESRRDEFPLTMESERRERFQRLLQGFNDRERQFEEAFNLQSARVEDQIRTHQERYEDQIQTHKDLIGSYVDATQRAQESVPVLAALLGAAKADTRAINTTRSRFEEALQTARADFSQFLILRDKTRAAMSEVSTGSVEIAQLLPDARQARDLACSEAVEISRLLQDACTNFDDIRSLGRESALG